MDAIKRKKIIIITLVVVIVGVLLYLAFRLTSLGPNTNQPKGGQLPEFKAPSANLQFKEVTPTVSDNELAAVQQAMGFAERFGTYSTDQPGENIKQLLGICTKKMVSYLNDMNIDYQAGSFKGMTTKSISYTMNNFADDQAEILVRTQRVERKAIDNQIVEETIYKDIKINLVKSGDQWFIDGAYWQ